MFNAFDNPFASLGSKVRLIHEWPPAFPKTGGLLTGLDYADPMHRRLAETPRESWGADDWKAYALFLEERGKWLLSDLQNAEKETDALRDKVKPPRKRGRPRTKQRPIHFKFAAGLLGTLSARRAGRPRDADRAERVKSLPSLVEYYRKKLSTEQPQRRVTDKAAIERFIEDYARDNRKSAVRLKVANVGRLQKMLSEARRTIPKTL